MTNSPIAPITPNDALARIDALLADDSLDAFLTIIDCITESADNSPLAHEIDSLLTIMRTDHSAFSAFLLSLSICPIHETDYAICFDDDDDECAQLRNAFPSHDI